MGGLVGKKFSTESVDLFKRYFSGKSLHNGVFAHGEHSIGTCGGEDVLLDRLL